MQGFDPRSLAELAAAAGRRVTQPGAPSSQLPDGLVLSPPPSPLIDAETVGTAETGGKYAWREICRDPETGEWAALADGRSGTTAESCALERGGNEDVEAGTRIRLELDPSETHYVFDAPEGSTPAPASGVTVQEQDGSPSYASVLTIQFHQGDGLKVTQPAAGTALVEIQDATPGQAGIVSTSAQSFGGAKRFQGSTYSALADGNNGVYWGLDPLVVGAAQGYAFMTASIASGLYTDASFGARADNAAGTLLDHCYMTAHTHGSTIPDSFVFKSFDTAGGGASYRTTLYPGRYGIWNHATSTTADGAANQLLGMDGAASLNEYKSLVAGANVTITHGAGSITIAASGGSGTVTSVSVASANGFAGSVANATTTPAITISTTVTGLLKGNGTAVSAAAAGTDYAAASHAHSAADITSGTMATARLGSGTADATTFLRGDQTYAVPGMDINGLAAAYPTLARSFPFYDGSANKKSLLSLMLGAGVMQPGCRLSGSASNSWGTETSSVGTLYLHPHSSPFLPLWDGTGWVACLLTSSISLALSGLTGGKPYDVFVHDASSPTLEFVAWTNDTTRATAVTKQDGLWCKSGDKGRLYVGSFYAITSNATADQASQRYVYSAYNRIRRNCEFSIGTYSDNNAITSFSVTNTSYAALNGGTNVTMEWMDGLGEECVDIRLHVFGDSPTGGAMNIGLTYDHATEPQGVQGLFNGAGNIVRAGCVPSLSHQPAAGRHYAKAVGLVNTGTGVIYVDTARGGSSFDPRCTMFKGSVMA